MKDRKRLPKATEAEKPDRQRRRGFQRRPERDDYAQFELGDGSKLDLDDPDVCHAISMTKRE